MRGGGAALAGMVCAIAGGGAPTGGRGVDANTSAGAGAAPALTLVGSSSSAPIASSMRVSPTMIVSPDWSLALLTFWPLTKVPFVEPRSMMLTSPGPLTSMIACMRLTVSSSSLEVRRGHLAELDDGQAQPLLADQLIALEDAERERCFCAGHGFARVEGSYELADDDERAASRRLLAYTSSADLMISGMKSLRILIRDECFAKSRASTVEPSGLIRSPSIVSPRRSHRP